MSRLEHETNVLNIWRGNDTFTGSKNAKSCVCYYQRMYGRSEFSLLHGVAGVCMTHTHTHTHTHTNTEGTLKYAAAR